MKQPRLKDLGETIAVFELQPLNALCTISVDAPSVLSH